MSTSMSHSRERSMAKPNESGSKSSRKPTSLYANTASASCSTATGKSRASTSTSTMTTIGTARPNGWSSVSWTGHPTVAVELDEGNRGELAQKHEPVKLEKRGFQLERRIGEEGERDLHSQKHDERPAHPRRDEPPTGEQEEDKQEEG